MNYKGNTAQFGKKSQPEFLPQFKVPKMEEYCMYFPFLELRKWGKKAAENRRRNCAVLPKVKPIGKFEAVDGSMRIRVYPEYRDAMTGLEDFAYVQVLWWFSRCDNKGSRSKQTEQKPYKKGSAILGTFATRAPERPNPIAVSTLFAASVDEENGIISLPYADAFPGTPVLDIKPYIPSLDRAESVRMPQWCAHWSASIEQSGDFDWASEFNF